MIEKNREYCCNHHNDSIDKENRLENTNQGFYVRTAGADELKQVGELLVNVYSGLDGFPKEAEQPQYYEMLRNVGDLIKTSNAEILVAVSAGGSIAGAVVYFNDMKNYGSGGSATQEKHTCGFRLLAVDQRRRGCGLGKLLSNACIEKGRKDPQIRQVIIHSTKAMKTAWGMYEKIGFERSQDLDFMQGELPVFGFRLKFE